MPSPSEHSSKTPSVPGQSLTRDALRQKLTHLIELYQYAGGTVDPIRIISNVLADLELLWSTEDGTLLSLTDAAKESRFSKRHLSRLAHKGEIAATWIGRRPFFRKGDLPRRPGGRASSGREYDLVRDTGMLMEARAVASSRPKTTHRAPPVQ